MASTNISRANGSGSATNKFTLSMWVKRGITDTGRVFSATGGSGDVYFRFNAGGFIEWSGHGSNASSAGYFITNKVFRDYNAWYHFVIRFDSTQASASNRLRFYVNGTQEESFSSYTDVNQNATDNISLSSNTHYWGGAASAQYFDGSMSHIHYTVGYDYGPDSFGSTDATTGEWKITPEPSVTYGSNGYFILKDGPTLTDSSPNSNNFAVANGTLTSTEDCPSNVFATLSTIYQPKDSGNAAMTNGNLRHGGSGDYSACAGIGMKTGKYYWEVKIAAGGNQRNIGIVRADKIHSNTTYGFYLAQGGAGSLTTEYSAGYRGSDGDFVVKSTGSQTVTSASTTITTGDIVGVAVDCDNYTIQFFKNGVSMQTLNLTSAFFDVEQLPADRTDDTTYFEYNFGNGVFGATAISSEGTNASGIGKFEYDVPAGYTALSTKGLNE